MHARQVGSTTPPEKSPSGLVVPAAGLEPMRARLKVPWSIDGDNEALKPLGLGVVIFCFEVFVDVTPCQVHFSSACTRPIRF